MSTWRTENTHFFSRLHLNFTAAVISYDPSRAAPLRSGQPRNLCHCLITASSVAPELCAPNLRRRVFCFHKQKQQLLPLDYVQIACAICGGKILHTQKCEAMLLLAFERSLVFVWTEFLQLTSKFKTEFILYRPRTIHSMVTLCRSLITTKLNVLELIKIKTWRAVCSSQQPVSEHDVGGKDINHDSCVQIEW